MLSITALVLAIIVGGVDANKQEYGIVGEGSSVSDIKDFEKEEYNQDSYGGWSRGEAYDVEYREQEEEAVVVSVSDQPEDEIGEVDDRRDRTSNPNSTSVPAARQPTTQRDNGIGSDTGVVPAAVDQGGVQSSECCFTATRYGESYNGSPVGCSGYGVYSSSKPAILAAPPSRYTSWPCGKRLTIYSPATGVSLSVVRVDSCPGCHLMHVDLSEEGLRILCGGVQCDRLTGLVIYED